MFRRYNCTHCDVDLNFLNQHEVYKNLCKGCYHSIQEAQNQYVIDIENKYMSSIENKYTTDIEMLITFVKITKLIKFIKQLDYRPLNRRVIKVFERYEIFMTALDQDTNTLITSIMDRYGVKVAKFVRTSDYQELEKLFY